MSEFVLGLAAAIPATGSRVPAGLVAYAAKTIAYRPIM